MLPSIGSHAIAEEPKHASKKNLRIKRNFSRRYSVRTVLKFIINPETPETGSCEVGYFVPDDGKPYRNKLQTPEANQISVIERRLKT